MTSSFLGIETARRGLSVQQAALNTTGHNISNANTAGYSRQRVNMQSSLALEAFGMMRSNLPGQLGTGVGVESVERVRQGYLDEQFRSQNDALGNYNVQNDTMDKLQTIFNEPSDSGIRSVVDNFWQAWSELSRDPENITSRKIVREDALSLTDSFHQTSTQLTNLNNDLTNNIQTDADQINSTIQSISQLNQQIQKIESLGDHANDLRDKRDLLTDNLSKMVNVSVQDTSQGYTIKMGNVTLVNGKTYTATSSAALSTAMSSGDLNNGEVHGMFVSRDQYVADYQKQLDTLADTLANGKITVTIPAGSVLPNGTKLNGVTYSGAARTLASDLTVDVNGINQLHQLGYTLSSPLQAGGPFFTAQGGGATITAANIQLSSDIVDSASNIATSLRTVTSGGTETVVKGNNTLALLVSNLKDNSFDFNSSGGSGSIIGNGTVDDFFRSLVGQLGVQTQDSQRQSDNQQLLVNQVDSRRQSESGVSLDEEMANLIKYQHAYEASARVMTTLDSTLNKVINGMGLVGR